MGSQDVSSQVHLWCRPRPHAILVRGLYVHHESVQVTLALKGSRNTYNIHQNPDVNNQGLTNMSINGNIEEIGQMRMMLWRQEVRYHDIEISIDPLRLELANSQRTPGPI